MSKLSHILFDCDGVLVDTEYIAATKMQQALEERGVQIDFSTYLQEHSGTTFSAIFDYYFGDRLPDAERFELMTKVEAEVAESVRPIAGVPELIRRIRLDKSVVSNSSIDTVRQALEVTGMAQDFNGRIFSSEQVEHAKPSPDLYLYATDSLGLNQAELLVIEDSPTGVQAAVSAGLKVIGFTGASHIRPGHNEKLMALGAIAIANTAEELAVTLERYSN